MDGPMEDVNPDKVDTEIGNTWRQLYKLEKGFDQVPAAKKIASKVKATVEEFKQNLPLIQTLFNPGLRKRHWEKISDIIGFPLDPSEPESDLCLSKLVSDVQ